MITCDRRAVLRGATGALAWHYVKPGSPEQNDLCGRSDVGRKPD